jgi:hypothetical protein
MDYSHKKSLSNGIPNVQHIFDFIFIFV